MKLKQKIALGLCAFYLISVIGIALSLHFCGGKLASVQFSKTAGCKFCKAMEKKAADNSCCKNSKIDAKVKDSHQSATKVNLPKNYGVQHFLAPVFTEIIRTLLPKLLSKAENKAPPFSARVSLYAYNCVFRN